MTIWPVAAPHQVSASSEWSVTVTKTLLEAEAARVTSSRNPARPSACRHIIFPEVFMPVFVVVVFMIQSPFFVMPFIEGTRLPCC